SVDVEGVGPVPGSQQTGTEGRPAELSGVGCEDERRWQAALPCLNARPGYAHLGCASGYLCHKIARSGPVAVIIPLFDLSQERVDSWPQSVSQRLSALPGHSTEVAGGGRGRGVADVVTVDCEQDGGGLVPQPDVPQPPAVAQGSGGGQ